MTSEEVQEWLMWKLKTTAPHKALKMETSYNPAARRISKEQYSIGIPRSKLLPSFCLCPRWGCWRDPQIPLNSTRGNSEYCTQSPIDFWVSPLNWNCTVIIFLGREGFLKSHDSGKHF